MHLHAFCKHVCRTKLAQITSLYRAHARTPPICVAPSRRTPMSMRYVVLRGATTWDAGLQPSPEAFRGQSSRRKLSEILPDEQYVCASVSHVLVSHGCSVFRGLIAYLMTIWMLYCNISAFPCCDTNNRTDMAHLSSHLLEPKTGLGQCVSVVISLRTRQRFCTNHRSHLHHGGDRVARLKPNESHTHCTTNVVPSIHHCAMRIPSLSGSCDDAYISQAMRDYEQ